MRLLVLGGTLFLGRHLVEAALGRGHEVSMFTRGETNPELFPQAEHLVGDRDGDLRSLESGEWDAVVDTSGRLPRLVRASAELLAGRVGHSTFVSSISAYADLSHGPSEDDPLAVLEHETEDWQSEAYGPLKALCEQAVQEINGERALVVRPGLIVGPWDPTGRFTYWPLRLADGGDVLAPEPPDAPVQVIDARDLAGWILDLAERRVSGVFNAAGPEQPMTMEAFLERCAGGVGSEVRLVWTPPETLLEHEVEEWMELPLWLADPRYAGMLAVDTSRAFAAGLHVRALEETARDTLAWARTQADPLGDAGLAREKERAILGS
jgi:2'-hydroxyisoflavone reductase